MANCIPSQPPKKRNVASLPKYIKFQTNEAKIQKEFNILTKISKNDTSKNITSLKIKTIYIHIDITVIIQKRD